MQAKPKRSAPAPTIDSPYKYASLEGGVELRYDGKASEGDILRPRPSLGWKVRVHKPVPSLQKLLTDAPPVPTDNRLIEGDNLAVLRSLLDDDSVRGKVRLVYIDPPFATGWIFSDRNATRHYSDELVGAKYLEFLRERLVVLRELLAPDGSIYLHLDDKMVHYAKVLMDEIFGTACFRNMITRQKCHSKNYTRKEFGNVADYILFYSKGPGWVWNKPWEPWDEEKIKQAEFQYREEGTGRRYKLVPLHAPGVRNGATGESWRGLMPPEGKHWQYTPEKLEGFDQRGEIHWSKNGNPRRKVFLDDRPGAPVHDIWLGLKDPMNQHTSDTGYPTEKNLSLLERVVAASSGPGDLVMDCFMGSGTTCVAAAKLGRRWIGIDSNPQSLEIAEKRILAAAQQGSQAPGFAVWAFERNGQHS
jgi:adenine-specific DNA-methyltransferase